MTAIREVMSTTVQAVTTHEPSAPVERVMSTDVHTLLPETDIAMAASFMRRYEINHLVVTTSDRRITGMVSAWDLLETLASTLRSHTLEGIEVAPVAPGDELIMHRPGATEPLRCRIADVQGPGGLPPYVVVWEDDPDKTPMLVGIQRHSDIALDGCER